MARLCTVVLAFLASPTLGADRASVATQCATATETHVDSCNQTGSDGLCVATQLECDVLGGDGSPGSGCGRESCFCCKHVQWRPTCAVASAAEVGDCLADGGLCVAEAADCAALNGVYDPNTGCGDSCGCCTGVGLLFAPSPRPTDSSSAPTVPFVVKYAKSSGSSSGSSSDDLDLLIVMVFLASVVAIMVIGVAVHYFFWREYKEKQLQADYDEKYVKDLANALTRTVTSPPYKPEHAAVRKSDIWETPPSEVPTPINKKQFAEYFDPDPEPEPPKKKRDSYEPTDLIKGTGIRYSEI